jgi:hypothetical protein
MDKHAMPRDVPPRTFADGVHDDASSVAGYCLLGAFAVLVVALVWALIGGAQ